MSQFFDDAPDGLQLPPQDLPEQATQARVELRELDFSDVEDKDSLMDVIVKALELGRDFGRNWDALYDVLTDPDEQPAKLALLLSGDRHLKERSSELYEDLEGVLLDAQAEAIDQGRDLWLLSEEAEVDDE